MKAVERYPKSEVAVKFTIGVLTNIVQHASGPEPVARIVQLGGIEIACAALSEGRSEYLLENAVLLLAAIAAHRCFAQHPALSASVIPLIKVLKAYGANKTMARHGNQALWCLGLEPALRVLIVRNAGLEVIEATADAVAQTLGVA